MANYSSLKAAIEAAIKTNGNQEITGQVLQDVLTSIVSVIGANYTFAGVATPSTNPGTPDQNLTYLAMEGGTYTNFNGTVLPAGISLLMWNGTWTSETVMYGDGGVFDISVYKSSGGTLATYADISAALDGGNNIPASARKGGMSVKYVQSSDNKYVQYRLMSDSFNTNVTNWQKQGPEISDCGNDFEVSDENNNSILWVKEGYPKTKNFDGEKIATKFDVIAAGYYSDDELYETVVVNIADYNNNLLNVYAAINPTPKKHYTILIPEGVYNVDQWFTQEYIENSSTDIGKRGVELMDYTKLLGVGAPDKVILQWMNHDFDPQHPNLEYISTLNTNNWNELENITVKANNIRYAVHDDWWNGKNRHIRAKNCNFIVSNLCTRVWGAGTNGGYDGVFEHCKFIMEHWANFDDPAWDYINPVCWHDNGYNVGKNSYITLRNCVFYIPYVDKMYYWPDSWEQITKDDSYPQWDNSKLDYEIGDCVNSPYDNEHSYRCLYQHSQVPPCYKGRASITFGYGAEGATGVLHVSIEHCQANTYLEVKPKLERVTGFGNNFGEAPILSGESSDSKAVIIDIRN